MPEAVLALGAFCVGYLRRFGVTEAGIGSQIYIGQLLAYSAGLGPSDLPMVAVAGVLAAVASIVPLVSAAPLAVWAAAALAMVIYAMSLADRYDIACCAYAFALIVTLAVNGENSIALLAARAWETLLGGMPGRTAATLLLFPLRALPGPDR